MPTRDFRSYVGLSRMGRTNNRYSVDSCKGIKKPVTASMLNKIQEFFTSNVFGWLKHDWRVPKAFDYPPIEDSVYPMQPGEEIRIGVAADWATDTVQSKWVGSSINKKNPDYTIHLGDTYFSGAPDELAANFGKGKSLVGSLKPGYWPRGRFGTFALCGNHEMFSSGYPYLAMITNPLRGFGLCSSEPDNYTGQESPNFCLYNDHWIIIGLDTGYHSLNRGIHINPTNEELSLPKPVEDWITEKVKALPTGKQRALIVLSHHQYVTAFNEETEFHNPAVQLKKLFPWTKQILWIWGHEHRFAMYGKNQIDTDHITTFGRCIGNGGMPDEHTNGRHIIDREARKRKLIVYDKRIADHIPLSSKPHSKTQEVGFNGYAMIILRGQKAEITYYAAYNKHESEEHGHDNPVFQEFWTSENGQLDFNHAADLTANNSNTKLAYFEESIPNDVGG